MRKRTVVVAAATLALSLGVVPVADAATTGLPTGYAVRAEALNVADGDGELTVHLYARRGNPRDAGPVSLIFRGFQPGLVPQDDRADCRVVQNGSDPNYVCTVAALRPGQRRTLTYRWTHIDGQPFGQDRPSGKPDIEAASRTVTNSPDTGAHVATVTVYL